MKSEQVILNDVLTEMIPVMRAACSAMPLNTNELKTQREAWLLVLLNNVPAARVKELFVLALRGMEEGKRILTAPDLVHLWRRIHREEEDRVRVLAVKPCRACGGTLKIQIYSPEFEQDINVTCPFHGHSGGKS